MIQTPLLSVVVPCYNEEAVLHELHKRLSAACHSCVGHDYEIIYINDGSTDQTWSIINALSAKDQYIIGVNLSRNHGHQLALTAGLSLCKGERILVIDADLQDPPELLPAMWKLIDQGADVVYGQRRTREGETAFKRITARWFYKILRSMSDTDFPVESGDFRLMTRRVVDTLQSMPEQYRFIRGMVTWIGYHQVPILYDRDKRYAGETKYSLKMMLGFAADAITGFSIRPLRIASYIGVTLGLFSLLLAGYSLYGWMMGDVITGWTSIMLVVLTLGSANMFFIGLIGEYLGRLYIESKHRPLFIIQDIIRSGSRIK